MRVCESCGTELAPDSAFCARCGRAVVSSSTNDNLRTTFGRSPTTGSVGSPVDHNGPVVTAGPQQAVPAAGRRTSRSWSAGAALAVIGLPILALVAGIGLVLLARRCPPAGCSATGAVPTTSATSESSATAPPSTSTTPPVLTAGTVAVTGRHVTVPVVVDSGPGQPPPTCAGTFGGRGYPFDCAVGRFELDGDYGQQVSVELEASNDVGKSRASVVATIPKYRTVVIHACSPPPCERIGLNDTPRRDLSQRGVLGDNEPISIDCWTSGDSLNTRFDEPGKPSRGTQIFYRLLDPYPGKYLWAPFVTDSFEQPVDGVPRC